MTERERGSLVIKVLSLYLDSAWEAKQIHYELNKSGVKISMTSVWRIIKRNT